MITDINIDNFRGISSLEIRDFKKINIFVGENNCGKTSVLEAIFMVTGISNPQLSVIVNNLRNLLVNDIEDLKLIFNKLDFKNELKIEAGLSNNQRRSLKISPSFDSSNFIENQNIKEDGKVTDLPAVTTIAASPNAVNGLNFDFNITDGENKFRTYLSSLILENIQNMSRFKTVKAEGYKETLDGAFVSPLEVYKNHSQELDKLIIAKQKWKVIEILRPIEPNIRDIYVDSNKLIWIDVGYESFIPINLAGDGMRKILYLATLINTRKNQIISIDEVENGLHYSSLQILWKALIKASFENDTQLFITTHSREALEHLSSVLKIDEFKEHSEDIRCFAIRKHAEDKIRAYKYDLEKLQYSFDQEIEIR